MRSSVGHTFAWDDKLKVKARRRSAKRFRPDRAGKQYRRFGLKKPDATGKERAGPAGARFASGPVKCV
jgi:hypothetical protein